MATKDELKIEIAEIAAELNVEVEGVDEMNHDQLKANLKDLKEQKEKVGKTLAEWVVAENRSITSKRGILKAGEEVKAEYLSGGEEALQNLIKYKILIKG